MLFSGGTGPRIPPHAADSLTRRISLGIVPRDILPLENPVTRGRVRFLVSFFVASLPFATAEASGGQVSPDRSRPELIVAAAADLVFALREIAAAFEREHQAKVTLTFVLGDVAVFVVL